jgi:hypothetical protein
MDVIHRNDAAMENAPQRVYTASSKNNLATTGE